MSDHSIRSYPPMRPETLKSRKPPRALEGLASGGGLGLVPNPLKVFHSKKAPIAPAFRATDSNIKRNIKEVEDRQLWLQPDVIDPTFGIKGDTKEVMMRRSFRRLESSALFNPVKEDGASLGEIWNGPTEVDVKRKFVLVEESRLTELAYMETVLREEKEKLGEQAAWVMNDFQIEARIPMPVTRIAVHNLCDADAKRLEGELTDLHIAWHNYAIKHNYDRVDAVLNRKSYMDAGPQALRALKLQVSLGYYSILVVSCFMWSGALDKSDLLLSYTLTSLSLPMTNTLISTLKNPYLYLMQHLEELRRTKRQKQERDTMMFEDDLSFLNQAHFRARERKLDYDRYYVFATRYVMCFC